MATGISYVNGTSTASNGATSLTATYSPTSGNIIIVFLNVVSSPGSTPTCVDSGSNSLSLLTSTTNGSENFYCFYYTALASITSFKCSWTTNRACCIGVMEYSVTSGTLIVSASNTAVNSGTNSTPSISLSLDDPNDFLVGGFCSATSITSFSPGTFRFHNITSTTARIAVGDNNAISATSVTITSGQSSSGAWAAIAGEIRFIPFLNLGNALLPDQRREVVGIVGY